MSNIASVENALARARASSLQPERGKVSAIEETWNALQNSLFAGTTSDIQSLTAMSPEGKRNAIETLKQAQLDNPTSGGLPEFIGSALGGIAPTAAAITGSIAFPPVAPYLAAAMLSYYGARGAGAGRRGVFIHEQRTGEDVSPQLEVAVAAGYTIATIVTERLGFKGIRGVIDNLAPQALRKIAKTYVKGSAKETAKVATIELTRASGGAALVEGSEEGLEEILTNIIDATYDKHGRSLEGIFEDVPRAVAAGALGGFLLGGLGTGMTIQQNIDIAIANEQFQQSLRNEFIDQAHVGPQQADMALAMLNASASYSNIPLRDYFNKEIGGTISKDLFVIDPKRYTELSLTRKLGRKKGITTENIRTKLFLEDVGKILGRVLRPEDAAIAKAAFAIEGAPQKIVEARFATAFISWMRKGKSSNPQLDRVMHETSIWIRQFYSSVKSSASYVELTPEVIEMFDKLTGGGIEGKVDEPATWLTKISGLSTKWEAVFDKLDIQHSWDKLTSALNETTTKSSLGVSIKNFYSVMTYHGLRAEDVASKMRKSWDVVNATDEELTWVRTELALISQYKGDEYIEYLNKLTPRQRKIIAPSYRLMNEYFDKYLGEYNTALEAAGINLQKTPFGFIERMQAEVKEKMIEAQNEGERQVLADLATKLVELEDAKFVHIPFAYWFAKFIDKNPIDGLRQLKVLASVKRHTYRIENLLKGTNNGIDGAGLLDKSQVDILDILDSYSRRSGKDLALLNAVGAAIKDGLARPLVEGKSTTGNFVKAPRSAPALKGFQVHPKVFEWISEMTRYSGRVGTLERGLSLAKMAQFANPFFLPMYDIIQAGMIGAFGPKSILTGKSFKYIRESYNDVKTFSDEFQAAELNGIASKPFANSFTNAREAIEAAITLGHKSNAQIHKFIRDSFIKKGRPDQLLKSYYNTAWYTAWSLDRFIRQISYRYLRDQGLSPSEAAQKAALYHGDYAGVPAELRHKLNLIFFTPTFKIAMGKLYLNMIKGAGEVIKNPKEADFDSRQNALSIARTGGILLGWHMLMATLGYEVDDFGRRYFKTVETEEGPKEQVITWAGPHNLFLKYIQRAQEALGPASLNPMQRFLETNSWELHPMWRTLGGIVANKKQDGSKIWEHGDSPYLKSLKGSAYFTNEIVAVIRFLSDESGLQQDREALAQDIGAAFEMFSRPFTFAYTRSVKEVRIIRQVNFLFNSLSNEIKDFARDGVPIPQENINRMLDRINRVILELD